MYQMLNFLVKEKCASKPLTSGTKETEFQKLFDRKMLNHGNRLI